MRSTRLRLALACLAIVGATVAVAGGSAGNRTADVTFAAFPGPASVTYAENIAYSVSIENTGSSTFTRGSRCRRTFLTRSPRKSASPTGLAAASPRAGRRSRFAS